MKNKKNKKTERIYLDNSASTAVDPRVLKAMNPYWGECIGNAGSIHKEGRDAKLAVMEARKTVAQAIHTQADSIVFTSGGTESNNLAIIGTVRRYMLQTSKKQNEIHIITGDAEHNSVYDCFQALEREGLRVTYVPVDEFGRVEVETLKNAITKETILISTILVNNEIGTIEDIKKITQIAKQARTQNSTGSYPLVHTDASQAAVWLKIDVQKLGVDFLTLDSQKIYGPKGVGSLYVKQRDTLVPIFFGGGQEFGLRPGTPPTPLIVGFSKAMNLLEEERVSYVKKVAGLRDWLFEYVVTKIPDAKIHGSTGDGRVAGNLNFSFPNIDGEQLVIELDTKGVAISTKSACLSDDSNESRVIRAINRCREKTGEAGTARLTLSRKTTKKEIEKAGKLLVESVRWLQKAH
jgi:cysteine desulfurase